IRGGAPLTAGTMIFSPTVDGRSLPHTGSFRSGTARGNLVVPADAAGKVLKVKLTIRAAGGSATRTASFHIRGAATPSVSIGDVTAAEGNGGTTTFSFPVTLSSAANQAVSVQFATSNGSATAPSDYAATNGTLTFKPGTKSKTVSVGVVGDLIMEQD